MPEQDNDELIKLRNIHEYLSQDRIIEIPPWQREYSWTTSPGGPVDAFVRDLHEFASNPDRKEYLIGLIILCKESGKPFLLIDGQQRSLTLSLFIMCARRNIKNKNLAKGGIDSHNYLMTKTNNCLNSNQDGVFESKISMVQENANTILNAIYDWSNETTELTTDLIFKAADSQTQTEQNLAETTKFIYEMLRDEWNDKTFIEYFENIINNVKLLELTLDSESEALEVYERINDRGVSLTGADLIKNILFQKLPDKDFGNLSETWQTMIENIYCCKAKRLQDPKFLLKAIAAEYTKDKVSYNDLVRFWKERFAIDKPSAMQFANELPDRSKALVEYTKCNHGSHGNIPEIFASISLGAVQHYPALLAGSSIEDIDVFRRLMKQINLRTVVYLFAKERTQTFENVIPVWANAIYDATETSLDSEIVDQVFKDCAAADETLIANLLTEFSLWDYRSSTDRRKVRALLSLLSRELELLLKTPEPLSEEFSPTNLVNPKKWHLEHITPNSAINTMRSEDQKIFQSIGNFVLLNPQENISAGGRPPEAKLEDHFYSQCGLALTKSLDLEALSPSTGTKIKNLYEELEIEPEKFSLRNWDKEAVEERIKFYSGFFIKIFNDSTGSNISIN